MPNSIRNIVVFAFLLSLVVPAQAHAYLDPAAGGLLIQMLLGGIAGAAVLFKFYWRRVLSFFGSKDARSDSSES